LPRGGQREKKSPAVAVAGQARVYRKLSVADFVPIVLSPKARQHTRGTWKLKVAKREAGRKSLFLQVKRATSLLVPSPRSTTVAGLHPDTQALAAGSTFSFFPARDWHHETF